MKVDYPGGEINLPVLKLKIHDPDHVIKTGLLEGLRDAMAAGESAAEARVIWPTEGRWDTAAGGHSQCKDVTGTIVWAFTKSPHLQTWVLPIGEHDMSSFPDARQLRTATKDQR